MKYVCTLLIILSSSLAFSQISHGGKPYSFQNNLTNNIATYINTDTDVSALIAEDEITDQHKDISPRFGKVVSTNLSLTNAGTWQTLANGDRIWRLTIQSPGATSINLNYDAFYLPANATLFLYNGKKTLGAFTKENNKTHGKFATTLLQGDKVTLEYYEPLAQTGNGIIQISSLVHGYRGFYNKQKAFGSSGSCNINAICDTLFWGNEIRSSVMQLRASNSRHCSAALINNTLQDGTPYVLIAAHCSPQATDIYMFNYQSADCNNNLDGPTTQTVVGATIIAHDSPADPSDFYLVRLSSVPPSNYNVFYAGWSNINTPPLKGTGIHYPSSDTKKISHDFDNLVEEGYYAAGNDHWKVNDWNTGTTEGGSSGSPLFDQNHRIVGQLHGGNAACGNDAFDYYGKFSFSWDNNADTLKQLKHWLDPNNSGATTIDGFDPNGTIYTTDAVLLNIGNIPNFVCGDSIKPQISIRNHGSTPLTSLILNYSIDGGTVNQYNWTGNLTSYQVEVVNLPTSSTTNGSHTFSTYCTNPNGITDQNTLNDSASTNFIINQTPLLATLNLTTDDYGVETSWLIKDNTSGDTLSVSKGYPSIAGGQNYMESLCLYDGCFTFILNDSQNDGYCCAYGNGRAFVTDDANGNIELIDSTFNTSTISYTFCLGTAIGIRELPTNNYIVYPNPSNGIVTIESKNNTAYKIFIYDVLGNVILHKEAISKNKIQLNLSKVNKGVYFIAFTTGDTKTVHQLIIN